MQIFINVEILTQLQLGAFKQPIKSKLYFYGFQLTYIQKSRWYQKRVWCEDVNIREKDENEHLLHEDLFKKQNTTDGLASCTIC